MFSRRTDLVVLLFLLSLITTGTTHIVEAAAWAFSSLPPKTLLPTRLARRQYDRRTSIQMFYRHRPAHEEQQVTTVLATSPSTTAPSFFPTMKGRSSQTRTTSPQDSEGVNAALMNELVLGQVALAATAVLGGTVLVGDFAAYDNAVLATWGNPVLANVWTQGVAIVAAVSLLIGMEHGLLNNNKAMNTRAAAAWRLQFSTNNLVVALWGRRGDKAESNSANSQVDDTEQGTTTDTWTALVPTAGLAAVTAACQESVFRYVVPGMVWQGTHSLAFAILSAALLDGVYHTLSNSNADRKKDDENAILMTQQCLQALVYSALVIMSQGGLWVAMGAHTLYLVHLWTTAWHGVNDQIDWAQEQQRDDADDDAMLSPHDCHVWKALQEHAQGALTAEHAQVLQRFFYAFDFDHQGTLSLQNVQMAVAYSFWNNGNQQATPSPTHVQALFRALVDARPGVDDGTSVAATPPDRLTWVEFLRLLVSLRAATRMAL